MANLNPNYGTAVQPIAPATVNPVPAIPTPTPTVADPYGDLAKKQPSTVDFMKQTDQELGIPEQQKIAGTVRDQIYSLEDALKRVSPNVDATTKQSLVTQGQRENMINAGQRPIQENLATTTQAYGRISEGITALQDRASRLTAGFSADKESALNLALSKIQRGEQLSDIEKQNAFSSLQSENEYKRQVEMAKTDFGRQKELVRLNTNENIRQSRATRTGGGGGGGGGGGTTDYELLKKILGGDGGTTTEAKYEYPKDSGIMRTQAEINAMPKPTQSSNNEYNFLTNPFGKK